ncbi:MAG: response regulator [Thermoplasmatales archaeon]|nr:MAG: response regulator [Thermoplasmatales archaeon]
MNKKVMVVDDEPDILISLKTVLEHECYEVITVDSGIECLKEIEKGFRGVVLLDIMMPQMDGWDTIKEIVDRGLIGNVAINIITGKGTKNHNIMGTLGSYIYDYLSKPLDIKELVSSVEKSNRYLSARNN